MQAVGTFFFLRASVPVSGEVWESMESQNKVRKQVWIQFAGTAT